MMGKRQRSTARLMLWLALAVSCLLALLHRSPAKVTGRVETTLVSFMAERPAHNRGIFASDAVLDLAIRNFTRVQSEQPETPIAIDCPTGACVLRFKRVNLDSLDTSGAMHFQISSVQNALLMKLERPNSRSEGICSIGYTNRSEIFCDGCDRGEFEKSKGELEHRLRRSPDRVLLWVHPENERASVELQNWATGSVSKESEPLEEERRIVLVDNTEIEFLGEHGSALRKGTLSFGRGESIEIPEGDLLAIDRIRDAQLDRLSFARGSSDFQLSWTAIACRTLQKHRSDPLTNLNPMLISRLTGASLFAAVASLVGLLSGLLGGIKTVSELLQRKKPEEVR
jgi:hypothetical protein